LLNTLTVKQTVNSNAGLHVASDVEESDGDDALKNPAAATSCSLCGVQYGHNLDQKSHIKSDFHRYNLKLKIRHQKPLTEAEFEKLMESMAKIYQ
jgi:hypothetical protein